MQRGLWSFIVGDCDLRRVFTFVGLGDWKSWRV